MYLKSLQLIGFKSFAEKTTLEFLPGVTAIVGPNGCGKSNVSDAIRWVLGEQSAKALRGAEMADVIFNGTDGRKAIGMCEVSMTFADVDPTQLSLPGVNLDYAEVTITRRVYRDGTGEYLINKTPCRLRDIQGLFMDTGIGRSSYSMMAQGQIDQILSARPDDRRNIFEEAAGINKYKSQKKEALRKLEYTEANLVRLTDIIKEVKRQIISLQRQAGKARRYKELFDELKTLDTRLARHKFDEIRAGIGQLEDQIAASAAQSEQFAAQVAAQETQIAELRQSLNAINHAITETGNEDHYLKNDHDRHAQRIHSNHERIAEFEQMIANHNREIAASEEKIRIQEQDLERLNTDFAQLDAELAVEQGKFASLQQTLQQAQTELAEKETALDAAKSELFELETGITRHRNELAALDHRKQQEVIRAERLSNERLELEDASRALKERLAEFNQLVVALRGEIAGLRATLAQRQQTASETNRQLAATTEAHTAAHTELSQKRSRLELLRQLFAAPDGRQTLGNLIEVEPAHGAAIEAALSHNLRAILADDLAAARELLAGNLKNPTIATCELAPPPPRPPLTASATPAQRALDVVRIQDARYQPLLESLLATVVIADDLDAALAIRAADTTLSVATRQGQFVSRHGLLRAVSDSHIAEIARLGEEVGGLQGQVDDLRARKLALQEQSAALAQEIAGLSGTLHDKEVAMAGKSGELNMVNTDQRETDNRLHTVMFELSSIEQQTAADKTRRDQLQAALADAESGETAARERISAAQAAVAELELRETQASEAATEQRIQVGGIEHRRASIKAQREPIAGRVHDLRERILTCCDDTTNLSLRIDQLRAEIVESEEKMGELAAARANVRQKLAGFQHQHAEVATGIQQAEGELRALRTEAAQAQQRKSGWDVQLAQKGMELQNLKERVWQKYQVNVEEVRPDAINVTVADHGPAVTAQVPLDTDWDTIEQQVAELQSKLDAMGPVNVEAIQEFAELEERYQHQTQQHEDLVKAKEQLLQIIAKINTTTRQMFSETFEKIRNNFQQMFTELFGGGKANLVLLDENDPLESGIEIVAKPPGKQLQSITLLSGGERTLTATALLFAIYMVKPSPFCVLDELDAPLDESNINRFIRILQRFVELSQFVVITHNKRTIGMADALYGVTMEEHGVSKVVSVKFSPREETQRKQAEQAREEQEDRIDGAAVVAAGPIMERPAHEEDHGNELLTRKEQTVAPIADPAPAEFATPAAP